MPTYQQVALECKLRAELDAAAEQHHFAEQNYQAALELQDRPWFDHSPSANHEVQSALLEEARTREHYVALLKVFADFILNGKTLSLNTPSY